MQSNKEQRVHQVFETISEKYDTMNAVISFNLHKSWRKHTVERMNIRPGAKVLDVCCGTADWTIMLAQAVGENGYVHGLDFSENMLEVGRNKIEKHRLENISIVHGNAMDIPFENNQFDYVTIGFGLRNVPDYLQVLNEMKRVVKPDGIVVCLETSQPTFPIYKQLYSFYFHYVMPRLGKWLANSYNEYSWLKESAKDFPGSDELALLFQKAGFVNIQVKKFAGGVAAMHLGYKPGKEI